MIEVRNQAEFDAAMKKTNDGHDEVVRVVAGRVEASGSASVVASGSASVVAWGSARVEARDSASVVASGSASVEAWGSARVEASSRVPIQVHSKRAKCKGGVQIDCYTPLTTADQAIEDWGAKVSRGRVTLYKAVRDDLKSQRGFAYPIGKTVEAPDWSLEQTCGGGLHLSPTPREAKRYDTVATRFLACTVAVDDLALCDAGSAMHDKVKARRVRVAYEVDIWGDRIEASDA
jgi:hypothetical protein